METDEEVGPYTVSGPWQIVGNRVVQREVRRYLQGTHSPGLIHVFKETRNPRTGRVSREFLHTDMTLGKPRREE